MLGDGQPIGVGEIARKALGIDHELAEETRVGAELAPRAAEHARNVLGDLVGRHEPH